MIPNLRKILPIQQKDLNKRKLRKNLLVDKKHYVKKLKEEKVIEEIFVIQQH